MDVSVFTRPRTEGDLLAFELDQNYCRERITILAGSGSDRVLPQFTVLGQVSVASLAVVAAKGAAASAANGTITGATVAAGSKPGIYVATCVGVVTNGGKFELADPDGIVLGEVIVGTAFTLGGITATIADGSTDWAEGDEVLYTVTATAATADANGVFKYVQVSAAATDGSQNAAGLLLHNVTAPNGVDGVASILARGPIIVRAEEIIWPVGASGPQIAAWTAQLAQLHFLIRTSG